MFDLKVSKLLATETHNQCEELLIQFFLSGHSCKPMMSTSEQDRSKLTYSTKMCVLHCSKPALRQNKCISYNTLSVS